MAIRSVSDAFYVVIARLPFLALLAAVVWVLALGVMHLERVSPGTEFFFGNHETTNAITPAGGVTDEQLLTDALASGDVERMEAALDSVTEPRSQRAPAAGYAG